LSKRKEGGLKSVTSSLSVKIKGKKQCYLALFLPIIISISRAIDSY